MQLKINNIFSSKLPADSLETNETRQVLNACFSYWLVVPQLKNSITN